MPFIGKNPTAGFASIVKDDFTPDGSTTVFTLSKSVANANDIAVFVGNVRQEPTDAYTASGTSLTMTEAVATGLNFYVLHIAGTIESSVVPAAGSITQAMIDPNVSLGGSKFKGDNGTVGTGAGDIFRVHEKELNTNVTIAGTENALCAGPLSLATGVTITVETGGTLVVA